MACALAWVACSGSTPVPARPNVAGPAVAGPKVAGPNVAPVASPSAGPKVAGPNVAPVASPSAGPNVAAPNVAPVASPSAGRVVWTYAIETSGPLTRLLTIDAQFAPTDAEALEVDDDGGPFVRDAEVAVANRWEPLPGDGHRWAAPCRAGCRIRYQFALREAAEHLMDLETALATGDVIVGSPSTWLLHPIQAVGQDRFRFRVTATAGARFATGITTTAEAADTFEASTADMAGAAFAVFGPIQMDAIVVGAVRVDLALAPHGLSLTGPEVATWVRRAATSLAAYYGKPGASRTLVIVVPGMGGSTRGETISDGGAAIVIRTAAGLTAETVRSDWVVTHELIHATLPSLGRAHAWLDEGIATYVEPIVRSRAGLMTTQRYWRELAEGLPHGLPEAGDEGLEKTSTWGRTYWGGALFCFVADIRIRQATHGARSFDDVIRGWLASRDAGSTTPEMATFLESADRSTTTTVVSDLYRELALAPGKVDLAHLWAELGVRVTPAAVTFDGSAPLASIRRAITAPPSNRGD
jgi:hypothetical protein